MAPYRQTERFIGGASRAHDLHHHHHHGANGVSDHVSIGVRSHLHKPGRGRRSARSHRVPVAGVALVLSLVLSATVFAYYFLSSGDSAEANSYSVEDDDDDDFLANVTRTETYKVLKFGKGPVGHGHDSRYWDRDDRRRDEDYDEDAVEHSRLADRVEASDNGDDSVKSKSFDKKSANVGSRKDLEGTGVGLYNEAGRDELKRKLKYSVLACLHTTSY